MTEEDKKDYRERYKRIAESDNFKKHYEGKSLGEVCHLKYCEKGYYNDLTEDEKQQFIEMLWRIDESSKKI